MTMKQPVNLSLKYLQRQYCI